MSDPERPQGEGGARPEPDTAAVGAKPGAPSGAVTSASPSVLVLEAASQQYSAEWAEPTVVTRRRAQGPSRLVAPSAPELSVPVRSYTGYVVWGVVGLLAFGLGGLIAQLRSQPTSPVVLQATPPAQTAATLAQPVAPSAPAVPAPAEAEPVVDEPAQLDELPKEVTPQRAQSAEPALAPVAARPTPAASPTVKPSPSPARPAPTASPARPAPAPSPAPVMIPDGI